MKIGTEIAYCLDASYWKGSNTTEKSRRQLAMEIYTAAYSKSTRDRHIDHRAKINGEANTINTGDGGSNQSTQNFVVTKDGDKIYIRKLTPVECERLQGYQDDWTKYGRDVAGKVYPMSRTQRYKQCGNGVSSPVSSHILQTLIPEGDVRVFSLFSGISGTELALPPRFKTVAYCEWDRYASDVLRYHHPDIPNFGDVTKLIERKDEIPEHDLLIFGHPCQAYSSAGRRLGTKDPRGAVIYSVFNTIAELKPKYILEENVKGLLTHNNGDTFVEICKTLTELGYEFDFEMVNSRNFGLAQNRERLFLFGRRKAA